MRMVHFLDKILAQTFGLKQLHSNCCNITVGLKNILVKPLYRAPLTASTVYAHSGDIGSKTNQDYMSE